MELRHLRYFLAVVEEANFGRAAKRCCVAQPTLSQQIKALERELGSELVDRSRRGTVVTEAGKALLPYAQRLLAEAGRAEMAVLAIKDGSAGTLRIGYEAAVMRNGMVEAIRRFRESVPGASLQFWETGSREQTDALRASRIDLALVPLPVDRRGLSTCLLHEDPTVAVIPAGHRLAGCPTVALAQLALENHVSWARHPAPEVYDGYLRACASVGFVPRIVQHVENVESMLALVAAGMGVGRVHAARVQPGYPGVTYAEVTEPSMVMSTGLAWRGADESPLLHCFLAAAGAGAGQTG